MPVRLRQSNLKLLFAFFAALATLIAPAAFAQYKTVQYKDDPTSYLTPDVMRVGDKLACRCGGCRNTVGNCPMLRCSSADPMRRRIYDMKARGMSDSDVVSTIVREEGVVALSSPPSNGLGGFITWLMPAAVLLLGFFIYSSYVRRNRAAPQPLSPHDQANIERFREQIDRALDDSTERDRHRSDDRP